MTFSKHTVAATAAAALLSISAPVLAADIEIVNLDIGTSLGLDDPSPRAPIGGNPGQTLGEQRLIAYRFAADLWGAVLQSETPVKVTATFQPLTCSPTSGVLGSAGANQIFLLSGDNLPGPTLFHVALAEAVLGININGDAPEIVTRFNGDIGVNPNCLTGSDWYYGLDGNTPPGSINFLNVVMHEIAHGLGFSGFANVSSGTLLAGFPDIYNLNAFNNTLGRVIGDTGLTSLERQFAFRDSGNTVWTGVATTSVADEFLGARETLQVLAPEAIQGGKTVQLASFGPPAGPDNFSGTVVAGNDGTGTLGCTPLINGTEVDGNIVLLDRGACAFSIKVANAQAAGAIGVIIADNVSPGLPGMGGSDPAITIPSIGISLADGAAIRANLPGVIVDGIKPDAMLRAGADAQGRVILYTPGTVAPGSTFSHFDTSVSPNALMEPFITPTLNSQIDVDLTPFQFEDIGWGVNRGAATFRGCPLRIPALDDNGIIRGGHAVARMGLCFNNERNKGQAQACVVKAAQEMREAGLIDSRQLSSMTSCAARTSF